MKHGSASVVIKFQNTTVQAAALKKPRRIRRCGNGINQALLYRIGVFSQHLIRDLYNIQALKNPAIVIKHCPPRPGAQFQFVQDGATIFAHAPRHTYRAGDFTNPCADIAHACVTRETGNKMVLAFRLFDVLNPHAIALANRVRDCEFKKNLIDLNVSFD